MDTTASLLAAMAELDLLLSTADAVPLHERDGLLLRRRAIASRLDAVQTRESQRPVLRVIQGGWERTLGLDVA